MSKKTIDDRIKESAEYAAQLAEAIKASGPLLADYATTVEVTGPQPAAMRAEAKTLIRALQVIRQKDRDSIEQVLRLLDQADVIELSSKPSVAYPPLYAAPDWSYASANYYSSADFGVPVVERT
jgi:hypothetical protein